MTAFAQVQHPESPLGLSWELRSVNHRYLEANFRLPESFRDLEGTLRDRLRQGLSRGKLECILRAEERPGGQTLVVDRHRAEQVVAATQAVAQLMAQPAPVNPLEILAWPGVLVSDAVDAEQLNAQALAAFDLALQQLRAGRAREGAQLAALIEAKLREVVVQVDQLRALLPQLLANQRQRILDRFTELNLELEPQRLEQELVLLAQKTDVAEELDRLLTHVGEVRLVLNGEGVAGRRLDFLMQELNREANTLGAKAFDPRSTQAAINLKVLIEQMREQVQNIE